MTRYSSIFLLIGIVLGAFITYWAINSGSFNSAVNNLNGKTTLVIGWNKNLPKDTIRMDINFQLSGNGDYFIESANNGRWDDKIMIEFKNMDDAREFRTELFEFLKSTKAR